MKLPSQKFGCLLDSLSEDTTSPKQVTEEGLVRLLQKFNIAPGDELTIEFYMSQALPIISSDIVARRND